MLRLNVQITCDLVSGADWTLWMSVCSSYYSWLWITADITRALKISKKHSIKTMKVNENLQKTPFFTNIFLWKACSQVNLVKCLSYFLLPIKQILVVSFLDFFFVSSTVNNVEMSL